jgi:hypothetical protein
MEPIELVRASNRTAPPGGQTPGMVREQGFAAEGIWTGVVLTQPGTRDATRSTLGMVSGWHHHGDHDTHFYVTTGGEG